MTTQELLNYRRAELLSFCEARFGTKNWTSPFCYCTGFSRGTVKLFRHSKKEFTSVAIASFEQAAMHLGFRPGVPKYQHNRFRKPLPLNLPRWADRACRQRFQQWLWHKERERKAAEFAGRRPTPATGNIPDGPSSDPQKNNKPNNKSVTGNLQPVANQPDDLRRGEDCSSCSAPENSSIPATSPNDLGDESPQTTGGTDPAGNSLGHSSAI